MPEYSKLKMAGMMVLERKIERAEARILGNTGYPELFGKALFTQMPAGGVIITVEVIGLPPESGFLGMHIHENGVCTTPFNKTGNHYNPTEAAHPMHTGDLPPLLNNNGYAYLSFYDNRFRLKEILGKSIIIHSRRDDFTSQPAGDSGEKIGCGVITVM